MTHEKYVFEGKEYSLLDIDLTPLINPNVKKEDISCTCKKEDEYAMPSALILEKDISIAKRVLPSSSRYAHENRHQSHRCPHAS